MSGVRGDAGEPGAGLLGERNRPKLLLLAPFAMAIAGAFAVRAFALWCDRGSLLFETGGLDANEYLAMAQGFWLGEWPGTKPFFWAPGYSFFLALLSAISVETVWFKLAQIVLGTGTCALIARLAWLLFEDRRPALLAVGMAALYGPLVYYDLQISPATLDVFLTVLVTVLLLETAHRRRPWLWILCSGCAVAASAVTRGGILLFVPLATLWLWRLHSAGRKKRAYCFLFAFPVLVAVTAIAAHNYRSDLLASSGKEHASQAPHGLVLISHNLGINFLLGNHSELYATNDVEHPLSFVNYKMAVLEPERHGLVSASGQSAYLFGKALEEIVQAPRKWLGLMARKVVELVHGEEISRDTSIYAARLENRVLRALLWKQLVAFPTGLLMPLAFLGATRARLRRREHALALAAIGTQVVFVLGFFVTTRYRLSICALAIPYAASALVELRVPRQVVGSTWKVGPLVCALVALVLCNRSLRPSPNKHLPFEYNHLGEVLARRKEMRAAASSWRTALMLDPDYIPAYFQLAGYYKSVGQLEAAAAHFVRGLNLAPDAYLAREEYADVLIRQGKVGAALNQFELALARAPGVRARQRVCNLGTALRVYVSPTCYSD